MTALDIFALLLLGGGALVGFVRGFTFEVLSLVAWVVGIAALKLFYAPLTVVSPSQLMLTASPPVSPSVVARILMIQKPSVNAGPLLNRLRARVVAHHCSSGFI